MATLVAVVTALTTGFLTGMWVSRCVGRWQRWCPVCGVTNVCPLEHSADGAGAVG